MKQISTKIVPPGRDLDSMNAIGKSLKQTGSSWMQDQEQWAQNVQGYMRGLPKPGSMSKAAPILIQLNGRNPLY